MCSELCLTSSRKTGSVLDKKSRLPKRALMEDFRTFGVRMEMSPRNRHVGKDTNVAYPKAPFKKEVSKLFGLIVTKYSWARS
jgi:hypothetical protein